MEVTASMVKNLREVTGAGMMDCKKALAETNGNMDEAINYLREKGIAKSAKKESRIAAEGLANIYIEGNRILSDQEVIEMAGVENYPGILDILRETKNNLKQNNLIKEAEIDLDFRKLTIKIEENYPLFYNANNNKTVLVDGSFADQKLSAPLLINYVPDTIYDSFVKAMRKVNLDIIERISEIKYDPDTVDNSRFLLSMRDGNYVYLTITKWDSINSYVSIIKEFPGKKGIIYLNAGNSFEVFE